MMVDGNMDNESRWSSKGSKDLILELSGAQQIGAVGVAWLKGDERASKFSVSVSTDGSSYTTVVPSRSSSGSSKDIEMYKFTPVNAKFVRISGTGNTKNEWNSVVEAKAYGCS